MLRPDFSLAVHELASIPEGRPGLDAKVAKIRALVEAAKRRPEFRAKVAAIVAGVDERDTRGEIEAVFDFVRSGVRYLRDPWAPEGLELFTEPGLLLEDVDNGVAAGDCDDHVILASAMLEAIGYRTRYRIGGLPPDHFRHIWLEARDRDGWVPLELVKKDEPFGYDPSHRFPLTLTLNGGDSMTYQGLGAPPKRVSADDYGRQMEAHRKDIQKRYRDTVGGSRRVRAGAPRRQAMHHMRVPSDAVQHQRRLIGLGDYEIPPSFTNTPQEERWFGFTPSDLWRQDELGDDEGIAGLTKKLKKVAKKVKKSSAFKDLKKLNKRLVDPREHFRALKKGVKGITGAIGLGGKSKTSAASEPAPAPSPGNVYSDPGTTGLMPPSVFGGSDGGGSGGAEMAEPYDPWGEFDARTEEGEIDSLYTEATEEDFGPDQPLPGQGMGSYVPTPDWEPTSDPFTAETATDGDVGMDYSAMDISDPTAIYGENEGGALGDWLTDLATNVGNTVIDYQKARLNASLAKKGIAPIGVTAQQIIPPVEQTPVPSVPAQTPANIIVQQPGEPRRMRRSAVSGLGTWGPIAMVGIGGIVLLALMRGARRSR